MKIEIECPQCKRKFYIEYSNENSIIDAIDYLKYEEFKYANLPARFVCCPYCKCMQPVKNLWFELYGQETEVLR